MSDNEKPKRGRPSKMDAKNVADVAMHAYWRDDPADVSINKICQLAAVSKPALYREFGNEDGLMSAVLTHYAEQVLSEIFAILAKDMPLQDTLDVIIRFASDDPKMETGCVFYKMRAGKHRLGPMTRTKVEEINSSAIAAFASFLEKRREERNFASHTPSETAARFLVEQIGLALTQRAAGENQTQVRETLELALAALK